MKWLRNSRYLLPVTLGLLGLLLLARVLLADTFVLVPEDADVIVLVALLSVTMIVAIHTIVRISMNYLRLRSVQKVRRETLAEHSRFLNRLDHELKNPLTALRAGLKTLGLTPLNQQQRQLVATMETETLRLSRLVTDLRKLAELETQPLNLRPVSMPDFAANILHLERDRFEAGERFLTSRIQAGQEITWLVDEDLLALAVHNLLDNAYKYTRPGDHVELAIEAQQELILRVSDTGVGISAEALPHIWEELYRDQQIEKIPGSGTGLALVKAIVERHDGAVSIESSAEQGTSVMLRLPALS
ncbi:MAG: HAMP domain-containing histidine kinase [Caldilineaceae bacterium]|nr:HAMP domain-containing histidine kinase [Caldilineaceae bacterium]